VVLLAILAVLGWELAQAEEPYQYSPLRFNRGMNAAAGPFFVGDEAIDVTNGLWDASGFVYPRNAFKLFNGRTRILGNREIGGMFRYVRYAEPPFVTASRFFLAAESLWIFQDSSVTDTLLAFKKQPIGTTRGTVNTASGSNIVTGTNTRFIQSSIARDPFFTPFVVDSASYFRLGGRARIAVKHPITDDTLELQDNVDSTATNAASHALLPAFERGTPKFFTVVGNRLYFGDSTKPTWQWDGNFTTVNYVVDSGRIYANTTTLLRDGTKAWFPNQWRSFWVRFAHRMLLDRGAAGGTDSLVLSPWIPIISNDDTSLTLKFDPRYGDATAKYYIMALPVERKSSENTVSAANDSFLVSADIPQLNERVNTLHSWPLSLFVTDGPGRNEFHTLSAWYKDTLFFFSDKFKTAPTSASRFVFVLNAPIFPNTVLGHQDRLWYVGDPTARNRVYYSEPLEPANVGPFNFVDVFPRDGDQVITGASYQDQLLVYKNNSVNRIGGDNPSNFIALPLFDNLGTPGINTRTSFAGDEYFYDKNTGIYILREFNPVRISDPIRPLLDSIPSAGAKNAALTVFRDHLWFSYPSGSNQSKNNRLLTYNVRFDDVATWSRHTFNRAANFAVWPLAGDSSRLAAGDPDSGLVYIYNDTARVDAYTSALLKLTYKTGWLALSVPELRKRFRGFQLGFDMNNASDRDSVFLYKDFATTAFDTLVFQRDGQLNNYVTKDMNGGGLGRLFQLKFETQARDIFKLYFGRMKWAAVGERQ